MSIKSFIDDIGHIGVPSLLRETKHVPHANISPLDSTYLLISSMTGGSDADLVKINRKLAEAAEAELNGGGGGMMSELNKFKRLISGGGGIDEGSLNDSIVIRGGGEKVFRGYGFTFL